MAILLQKPAPGGRILLCAGDTLEVSLAAQGVLPRGRAYVRTSIPAGPEPVDAGGFPWRDVEMECRGGDYRARIQLAVPGVFAFKTLFVPDNGNGGAGEPLWPEGGDVVVKVQPAWTRRGNSIYTAFTRQFSSDDGAAAAKMSDSREAAALDAAGYAVIPPSGTFRELSRRLDHIIGDLGFRIIQLLPIHPVPTTYARMGRFGSPFAGMDFFSVDPALAEFDRRTTPMEQFGELVSEIHRRGARIFLDIPANHTGWASTLQTRFPEYFKRNGDGSFHSPGAWGVTWEDLVELDFDRPELADAVAEIFLFWCAKGVDGFRCDAGYMVPARVWKKVTGRVRAVFPDTVFLLEGLGGKVEVTDDLLANQGLDWAYSEIFQQYDRNGLEWYLGGAIGRSETIGPLVNFAETHDNDRLAARGERYASMRTALAALLSQQGAFGITAGVEWFCRAKVDVHGAAPLNWNSRSNQIGLISRLNAILDTCEAFASGASVEMVTRGGSNVIAALREVPWNHDADCLVAVNLDCLRPAKVEWDGERFSREVVWDLISSKSVALSAEGANATMELPPGGFAALTGNAATLAAVEQSEVERRANRGFLATGAPASRERPLGAVRYRIPVDFRREVMVPPGQPVVFECQVPFRVTAFYDGSPLRGIGSALQGRGLHSAELHLDPRMAKGHPARIRLEVETYGEVASRGSGTLLLLPEWREARVEFAVDASALAADGMLQATLANRRGAAAQVAAEFGAVRSQYDAFLAINTSRVVPAGRQVFFTRCKAWVRRLGYSFALDATTQTGFQTLSSRAVRWTFSIPAGEGRKVAVVATLELSAGDNAAKLLFAVEGGGLDGAKLIIRPDIEARDFHTTTRAYSGPEKSFPQAVSASAHGYVFAPPGFLPCSMSVAGGEFHMDPEWSYSVAHPVEAGRGLEPCGDLFSPGWFSAELAEGTPVELVSGECGTMPAWDDENNDAPSSSLFGDWIAGMAGGGPGGGLPLYIADRDENLTVIAGFPWFLDWGRDTLIVLRGLVAAGMTAEAMKILCAFARFEENGTLPNIIHGDTVGNRDTSDAPLWFVVAAGELMKACGGGMVASARAGTRTVADAMVSIARGYAAGTPAGVRLDPESGLVFSPSHFTWMDTNYPAGTPRAGYPVEIQALWIAALETLRTALGCREFIAIEATARRSFHKLYPLPQGWLADNLRTADGRYAPAFMALPEDALRPNQLLAVTLGAVDASTALAAGIVKATEALLVPGGIRSLDDAPVLTPQPVWRDGTLLNDPNAPYWGHYEGDEDTRRKPAYHNGTAWCWQFPMWCEAFALATGDYDTALSYLASSAVLAERGSVGQLPEILDGDAPHTQRGCLAQAWSVSELARVWLALAQKASASSE